MRSEFQEVVQWLNQLVDSQLKYYNQMYLLDDWRTCKNRSLSHVQFAKKEIQLYGCIEHIAEVMGLTLTYDPNWYTGSGNIYFEYRGIKFFELWDIA